MKSSLKLSSCSPNLKFPKSVFMSARPSNPVQQTASITEDSRTAYFCAASLVHVTFEKDYTGVLLLDTGSKELLWLGWRGWMDWEGGGREELGEEL
jgi:hypothetical protein